jgi:phage protein D
MTSIEYRLFFDNRPSTRDQLDSVRTITVEQEVDMAWEARVKIPIVVDEKGQWTGEDDDFMKSFSRVRIEIKLGNKSFVPLIDGPIVGFDRPLNSEPGRSFADLIVSDDSVSLNQKDEIAQFENVADSGIAAQIFQSYANITSTDIQTTQNTLPVVVQRCTDMQMLRMLAKRNGIHAYLLPSNNVGESIGCFKPFATKTDGLTPLILLGPERNLVTFNVTNDSTSPLNVKAFYLNMADKSISEYDNSYSDAPQMGTDSPLDDTENVGLQILSPYQNLSGDPEQMVAANAMNSSYSFEATGEILENCYPDVLEPYHVISILGINASLSGDYLITKVTHKLNRTFYSQSFTVRRNALSAGSNKSLDNLAEVIS